LSKIYINFIVDIDCTIALVNDVLSSNFFSGSLNFLHIFIPCCAQRVKVRTGLLRKHSKRTKGLQILRTTKSKDVACNRRFVAVAVGAAQEVSTAVDTTTTAQNAHGTTAWAFGIIFRTIGIIITIIPNRYIPLLCLVGI
jgi:hypothetical protein